MTSSMTQGAVAVTMDAPVVPSGLVLTLFETIEEDHADGRWLRLRYVAPGLEQAGFSAVADDFAALCETIALPLATDRGARRAVISLASEPLEFGARDSSVTQFFESYRIENGTCIWEPF